MTIEKMIKWTLYGVSILVYAVAYHAGYNFFGAAWASVATVVLLAGLTV